MQKETIYLIIMPIPFKYDILDELFTMTAQAPATNSVGQPQCLPDVYKAFGGRILLINYYGTIGLSCLEKFKPSLFATLTGDAQKIIVGLESVGEFSRSSLGALVDFASAVLGRGKRLYLLEPSAAIVQSLKELQLTMFFGILQDEEALIRMLPEE